MKEGRLLSIIGMARTVTTFDLLSQNFAEVIFQICHTFSTHKMIFWQNSYWMKTYFDYAHPEAARKEVLMSSNILVEEKDNITLDISKDGLLWYREENMSS